MYGSQAFAFFSLLKRLIFPAYSVWLDAGPLSALSNLNWSVAPTMCPGPSPSAAKAAPPAIARMICSGLTSLQSIQVFGQVLLSGSAGILGWRVMRRDVDLFKVLRILGSTRTKILFQTCCSIPD
jgi:hypothetical protein